MTNDYSFKCFLILCIYIDRYNILILLLALKFFAKYESDNRYLAPEFSAVYDIH